MVTVAVSINPCPHFCGVQQLADEYNIPIIRIWGIANHSKGEKDHVGGLTKTSIRREVANGNSFHSAHSVRFVINVSRNMALVNFLKNSFLILSIWKKNNFKASYFQEWWQKHQSIIDFVIPDLIYAIAAHDKSHMALCSS